jgi:hypothetical protein
MTIQTVTRAMATASAIAEPGRVGDFRQRGGEQERAGT